jgi:hypothetical protein
MSFLDPLLGAVAYGAEVTQLSAIDYGAEVRAALAQTNAVAPTSSAPCLAQSVKYKVLNLLVVGSSPTVGVFNIFCLCHLFVFFLLSRFFTYLFFLLSRFFVYANSFI